MAYTIELSRQEEEIVQRRAARLGISAQEYIRLSVGRQLRSRRTSSLALTQEEQQTLEQWETRLPSSFWQRYAELTVKLRARELSNDEQTELKQMATQEEAWNGERLQLLQTMARKRGTTLLFFMKHNHIGHHPDADRYLPS